MGKPSRDTTTTANRRSVQPAISPSGPAVALCGLARVSLADIHREICRRAKLLAKIAAIDEHILAAGGSLDGPAARGGTGRKRPKNDTNLIDALRSVLKGKTMGVSEAAEAVQKAGYRTSAANFKTMVNANLGKKKFFKRVERGRYTAA